MTTTTTGTNGFPVRYIAMAVVAAALAAVIIAISQQAGTDVVQTVSAPKQAATQEVAPATNSSSLSDALANGKLDSGFGSTEASTATVGAPAPKIVEIAGQGANYDALIAGKFGTDFGPDADVRYVRAPGAASGGLTQALAKGQLDEAPSVLSTPTGSAPAPRIVEVTGQGANYDALIAGKFGTDFDPDASVRYVRSTPSGMWKALEDGKLREATTEAKPSTAFNDTPAISGGHQE